MDKNESPEITLIKHATKVLVKDVTAAITKNENKIIWLVNSRDQAIEDNDTVQFDLRSSTNIRLFGVGIINGIKKEAQGVGNFVRLRYSFGIQLAQ